MDLPSIEEMASECEATRKPNKLTEWERSADAEQVDWFWNVMRTVYVGKRMRFANVHRAVAKHLAGFPEISSQTLKTHVDARLTAER